MQSSLGKITIVDFWASWCPMCRKESPDMVKLYNDFHKKGLNIVGVSLDDDASKWKAAIAKDKLLWVQVCNLKKWNDPIAKQYNVQDLPSIFILDASGKIIAQNLHGEELRSKISALLGSK